MVSLNIHASMHVVSDKKGSHLKDTTIGHMLFFKVKISAVTVTGRILTQDNCCCHDKTNVATSFLKI